MEEKRTLYGLAVLVIVLVAIGSLVAMPVAAQSDDRFEPNDHSGEAAEIEPGTYDDLSMSDDDWADYYAVELEEGESLDAAVNFEHDQVDLDAALIEPGYRYADWSFSDRNNETLSTTADEAGTYKIVVLGLSDESGSYQLSVDTDGEETAGDRFESNDDVDDAAAIEPGEYANLSISDEDRDVFAVEADAGDQIVANSQIHRADADLSLDVSGDEQTAGASAATEWRPSGLVASEDGTYYVTVTSNAAEQVFYDLRVGVGQSDRYDPNEQAETIPTVEPGDHSNLSLAEGPDVDSYAVDVEAGHTLSAHTDPGDDTEVELVVTDADGEVVAESDKAPYHAAHSLKFTANESGSYTVNAFVANGTAAYYDLDLEIEEPVTSHSPGLIENQTVSADNTQRYDIAPTSGSEQVAVAARTMTPNESVDVTVSVDTFIATDGDTTGPWSGLGFVTDQSTSYEVAVSSDASDPVQYDLYVNNGSADSFDPNEEQQNAAEIEAGTHENLSLVGPADTDYYALDLTEGSTVSLSTEPQHGQPVDFRVIGPDGEQVAAGESLPEWQRRNDLFGAGSNGTYIVEAYNENASDHEGSTYDLEVEVDEPDPTYADGRYADQTVTNGSPNVYEVQSVEGSELLAVSTELEDRESNLSVTVRGPFEILHDDEGDRWRSIETVTESGGPYTVEVSTDEDEPVNYDLELSTGEADSHEPNGWEQKTQIEHADHENLVIQGLADQDAYAVDLEAGERLRVNVTSADVHNTTLFLRNVENDHVEFGSIDGDTRTATMVANGTGTYAISVSATTNRSIEYDLGVSVHNQSETATDQFGHYPDESVTAGHHSSYKVNVQEGELLAAVTGEDAFGSLNLTITAPDGTETRSEGSGFWNYNEIVAEETGTYEITVTTESTEPLNYHLDINTGTSDRFEPNDYPSAASLQPGHYENLTFVGPADSDYYAIELDAGETLTATFEPEENQDAIDAWARGPNNAYAQGDQTSNGTELTLTADQSGTYYLETSSDLDGSVNYDLGIDVTES